MARPSTLLSPTSDLLVPGVSYAAGAIDPATINSSREHHVHSRLRVNFRCANVGTEGASWGARLIGTRSREQ